MNRTARGGAIAAVGAMLVAASIPAGAQVAYPAVGTSIDQVQVVWDDEERTRPSLVSWRTTGEVESGAVTLVPEDTFGDIRYVERSQLGPEVQPDYPVSLELSWHTPYCDDSSEAAQWIHDSDFLGRGRAWVGLEGTELTRLNHSNAPDGSRLQWAEVGVGGLNRFPPQEARPGGHIEARAVGTVAHRVEWFDPSESCFSFGVRRVTQDVAVSMVSIEAVDGDVTFQGGEDLPSISVPVAGQFADEVRGYAFFYQGLPGLISGLPGVDVAADSVLASDEDGSNPRLQLFPFVRGPGTWHEARRTSLGTDWQLRFTVVSWTETVDFGSEEMGKATLFPGERAVVVTRGEHGDRVQRFSADALSTLRIGQEGGRLLRLTHEEPGTPFIFLNSCGLDQPTDGFPVVAPTPATPGGGLRVGTPGLGDPDLPHAIPPGWMGFELGQDASGSVTLRDVTIAGDEFGDLSLPYVRVDGALHRITPQTISEGPIVFQRQYSTGGREGGISWDTVMLGMAVSVDGVDLRLYWSFHGKVMANESGTGACARVEPIIAEAMNPEEKDVGLIWFVRAKLGGRPETYAKYFEFGSGYQVVEQEKTFQNVLGLGLYDSGHLLGLLDKGGETRRFMIQQWQGLGDISLVRHHGVAASDPAAEVNGESVNGADLGYYMAEERGAGRLWSDTPFLVVPCGPWCAF